MKVAHGLSIYGQNHHEVAGKIRLNHLSPADNKSEEKLDKISQLCNRFTDKSN